MKPGRPLSRRTPLSRSQRPGKANLRVIRGGSTPDPARELWKRPVWGRCEACGRQPDYPLHHHHVISRQVLARARVEEYHPANGMRLCASCHFEHHFGMANRKIPMAKVPLRAVEWAVEALGEDIAVLYLDRHYAKDAA